jgi:hypothetical protein
MFATPPVCESTLLPTVVDPTSTCDPPEDELEALLEELPMLGQPFDDELAEEALDEDALELDEATLDDDVVELDEATLDDDVVELDEAALDDDVLELDEEADDDVPLAPPVPVAAGTSVRSAHATARVVEARAVSTYRSAIQNLPRRPTPPWSLDTSGCT